LFNLIITSLLGILMYSGVAAAPSGNVTLYTPYTKITVPPGQSVNYQIDLINNSKVLLNANLSVSGVPYNWKYSLESGGWNIGELSVLPGERKNISLKVDVPYQVNKGTYHFKIMAADSVVLPLAIVVSSKGTYETELTTDQPNMQGSSTSTFTFRATLKNQTAEQQLYALMADVSRGWNVTFKADYKPVTSVELNSNTTKDVTIDITAPSEIEAGTYQIPISAKTNSTSANLSLEVVITGTYKMELTTPTGLLSSNVTAGDEQTIPMVVRNTGSSLLSDVRLSASTPSGWRVDFKPQKIEKILPGKDEQVTATVKADKKAIPGDYVLNMDASTPETKAQATFRMAVKTPLLWGWIGILVIIIALSGVFYLFRKYGRR
jgi:uncharacterized membrane protein